MINWSIKYSLISTDSSSYSSGKKVFKLDNIWPSMITICSLQDKLLITHVLRRLLSQSSLTRQLKSRMTWNIFMNLPRNYPAKIKALHWVTLTRFGNSTIALAGHSLSSSRKIRKSHQSLETFIILWVMSPIKIDFMNLMDCSLGPSSLVNMNNPKNG